MADGGFDFSKIPNPMSAGAGMGDALGGGIGDIIGWFMSRGDDETAKKLLDQATGMYSGLNPNVRVDTEGTEHQGDSAYNQMQLDPATRNDQLAALDQLHQTWSAQGLDPIARAQMAETAAATEGESNALNNAAEGMAAQRGMSDSGSTLAAQRSNAQAAANTGALQNSNAMAAGQMRGMNALNSYLGGASAVRGQDYQQGSDKASAQDAINRFNAANAQAVRGRNIDRNVAGQESTFQQGYQQAQGVGGQAGEYQKRVDRTIKGAHDAGAGVGSALGGAAGAAVMASDERLKRDIVREADEALPGVPFATWEWPHEPGVRHRGVIAQDLEKVAPQFVLTRGDGVKFVDYSFLQGGG